MVLGRKKWNRIGGGVKEVWYNIPEKGADDQG